MRTRYLVFIAAVVLASFTARANERAEAERHYVQGTKAFDLGAYDEAIAEYAAAYRIKPDPALLYNLGQAHRLANHPIEALHFYKMFLTKVPEAPNRDEVAAKIAELETAIEQQQAGERQRQQAEEPHHQDEEPHPAPAASPAIVHAEPAPAIAEKRPARTAMLIGATLVGVGVAAVGGGIACGILAQQNGEALTKLSDQMMPFDAAKESAGKTEQVLEGVLLGVGGAAIVTGVVLLVLKRPSTHRALHASSVNLRAAAGGIAVTF